MGLMGSCIWTGNGPFQILISLKWNFTFSMLLTAVKHFCMICWEKQGSKLIKRWSVYKVRGEEEIKCNNT